MTHPEIAADLEDRIYAGEYPPGSFIPSYRKITELYGVRSESTAEKAVAILRGKGLIEQWRGLGNAVVDPLPPRAGPQEPGEAPQEPPEEVSRRRG